MISVHSIKHKILIFAVLATLIPSVGLGLLSYRQYETVISGNVTHQLRGLAGDAGRELEFWYRERVDGLRALSASDAVINGLAPGADTAQQQVLAHYLQLVEQKLDPLLELAVLDANGGLLAHSAATPSQFSLPTPWPGNAATQGVIVEPPHWNARYARPTFVLAVAVLSLDDTPLGALLAVVDLSRLQTALKRVADSAPGELVLLDLRGRPLLASRDDAASLSPIDSQTLDRLRTADAPITFKGHSRRKVLGLAAMPRTLPLLVVAERAHDEIYQAWVLYRNLFLTLLGGLTLLVGLVGWGMGRSIVAPLKALTRAADRIAAGDLRIRLPVARRDEIGHLTRVFNQMTDNLRHTREEVEAANRALQQQNRLLETLSITDSLTGLYNRKKLDEILEDQLARYRRNRHPFAVLLLDIDHFKALNDNYGHLAGDEVLKSVAAALRHSIRSVDFAARYGGEEFVIVLPETTTATARDLAERICGRIRNSCCQFQNQSLAVTLSIGVAGIRDSDDSADALLGRADAMLYEAKNAGRNRVHCAL